MGDFDWIDIFGNFNLQVFSVFSSIEFWMLSMVSFIVVIGKVEESVQNVRLNLGDNF